MQFRREVQRVERVASLVDLESWGHDVVLDEPDAVGDGSWVNVRRSDRHAAVGERAREVRSPADPDLDRSVVLLESIDQRIGIST